MAETPKGHPLPHQGDSGFTLPIFKWKYPPQPQWVCGSMKTLDGRHVANRDIWLGVELNASQAIRRVCREAARFAQFIRRHCGLPEDCGTSDLEATWDWTVLELAAVGVPGSLLRLEEGGVFRCADDGVVWATEDELARAESIPPTANDLWSQIMRRNFDPTRYWLLEDLVEASVQVMDIVEVAIASGAATPPDAAPTPPSSGQPTDETKPKRRGEPAAERLRQLWVDPEGKKKILAAGNAEGVALLIGRSKTAVVEAGPIWDDKIAPALKAQRDLVRYHREEERLDR
jgi:hypothetical protein